ncbi:MAG: ribosome biogenesis GTPase Der [Planctomycetota bacterium]
MTLPTLAVVGRPNVGKSSLMNRLAGRRVSIVEPTAGVTRDRVTVPVEALGRRFEVIDTGGLGLVDEEKLKAHIEHQIDTALSSADAVIFVVDGKEGLVPGDEMVAQRLRRLGRNVVLAVNKIESYQDEMLVHDWARVGFGEPIPISALEGFGISELLQRAVELLPEASMDEHDTPRDDGRLKFAVVGKRNSGKSTLINHLAGSERVIVSEIPGTTRDSVDVVFDYGDHEMVAIDTAGVRKKSSLADAIELFSYARATESIRRADVVLHMFDVSGEISQVDKKVAQYCAQHHKPVVLAGNKIDLADELELAKWDAYIKQQLAGLRHAPVVFLSAKEGENVHETLQLLKDLDEQASTEIPTASLNEVLQEAKIKLSPKSRGKYPKLYYGTQVGIRPVSIVIFVNDVKIFRGQYERYLANILRQKFEMEEIPIRILFKPRARKDEERPSGAPSRPI